MVNLGFLGDFFSIHIHNLEEPHKISLSQQRALSMKFPTHVEAHMKINLITPIIMVYAPILKTSLILFSNKMLVIRAGISKTLVRVANRENPDQTASESSEAV